jgi:hypothetical protein
MPVIKLPRAFIYVQTTPQLLLRFTTFFIAKMGRTSYSTPFGMSALHAVDENIYTAFPINRSALVKGDFNVKFDGPGYAFEPTPEDVRNGQLKPNTRISLMTNGAFAEINTVTGETYVYHGPGGKLPDEPKPPEEAKEREEKAPEATARDPREARTSNNPLLAQLETYQTLFARARTNEGMDPDTQRRWGNTLAVIEAFIVGDVTVATSTGWNTLVPASDVGFPGSQPWRTRERVGRLGAVPESFRVEIPATQSPWPVGEASTIAWYTESSEGSLRVENLDSEVVLVVEYWDPLESETPAPPALAPPVRTQV